MPIEIDASLAPELVPLSWLVGSWEGVGVVGYPGTAERQFGQRIDFGAPEGASYLHYTSQTWLLDLEGNPEAMLTMETGFWQLVRPRTDEDPGPGMIAAREPSSFTTAESVESLRNADGVFDLEVAIVHPGGVMEMYAGTSEGAQINLATDVVARTTTAKEYSASKRLYGYVKGELMWAWDMAAAGEGLTSHASARLKKVGSVTSSAESSASDPSASDPRATELRPTELSAEEN
ncbi:FABP family protein [Saxibacter everestensis]|uniref:FABP family protein n=1 Tax=Saxibacter everestensis TaxID=2909229 RepID=UPI0032E35C89